MPEYVHNEVRTMQNSKGKKLFSAFTAVAAGLYRKNGVSSDYILASTDFETMDDDKYTNMLSIKKALLVAGVPNVSGYLIQDPYDSLNSHKPVAVSVIGPKSEALQIGKPYFGSHFYLSYMYNEQEVFIMLISGIVCSLPPQEFSSIGGEKPFLILGTPPNNSFKADAVPAQP